jgi:hypothetical protein
MITQPIPRSPSTPSHEQRFLRRRASELSLRGAVRLAVRTFFQFSHRAERSTALWCRRERVWLGRQTYLSWAMDDAAIAIPGLVANAPDAPQTTDELHEAIREELIVYWTKQLASLPEKSTPRWLALP